MAKHEFTCTLNEHITQMYNLNVYGNSPNKKQKRILADIVASNEISGPNTLSLCLDLVCGCSQLRSEDCASVCLEMSSSNVTVDIASDILRSNLSDARPRDSSSSSSSLILKKIASLFIYANVVLATCPWILWPVTYRFITPTVKYFKPSVF